MRKLLNLYKTIPVQIKASFWFLVCAFLQKGISTITTPIFTRLLSPAEYGKYAVFISWQSIINCFVTLNLYGGMYTQGLVKLDYAGKEKLTSSLHGLILFLSAIWIIIYFCLRNNINNWLSIDIEQMILMFCMITSSSFFNFWSVKERINYKYKRLVLLTLLVSILNPLLCIILILKSEDKVTARILGTAIINLIFYIPLLIIQIKKEKSLYNKNDWSYALKFCVPLIPHYLSSMILNSSDRIMIQRMIGDSAAGVYSLAYSVSLIMQLFNSSLLQTIEPYLYQQIKDNNINNIGKIAYPSFVFIALVNILLLILAPEVINIFAPASYSEAIWVIPPIAMSVFFMFMYSFFAFFEFYFEKPNYITIATSIGAIVNLLLNYIFIKEYGYKAAGYTTLICYILYTAMHYFFMRKIVKEKLEGIKVYNICTIIAISCIFLIMGFVILLSYSFPVLRIIIFLTLITLFFTFRNYIFSYIKKFSNMRKKQ